MLPGGTSLNTIEQVVGVDDAVDIGMVVLVGSVVAVSVGSGVALGPPGVCVTEVVPVGIGVLVPCVRVAETVDVTELVDVAVVMVAVALPATVAVTLGTGVDVLNGPVP